MCTYLAKQQPGFALRSWVDVSAKTFLGLECPLKQKPELAFGVNNQIMSSPFPSLTTCVQARSGVKRLRVIDFDQVSLSSLNRHAVATWADVGYPKVTRRSSSRGAFSFGILRYSWS